MATQSKYDKEKKKDKKTWEKEETNGRLSTTSSKSSVKDDTSANKKASSSTSSSSSSTSANRGNANRSNYTPKYNTYNSKTNTYSYVPKTSTSQKATTSQKTTSDPWSEWLEFVRSKRNETEASKASSTSSATSSATGKRGEVNRSRTPKYNTYNSQTGTWSYNPYVSETEDQREARSWLAQAGITDLSNMTDIEATRQKVYDTATATNADDFKSSPEYVKFLTGKNAYNAEMYRQNLIAGLDELGLSEEERNRILGEANTKADTASEIYALARARMGDQSAVEQLTGDARTEAERLAKMYGYDLVAGDDAERWSRLYGYDTATELLSQQLPSEMQQAGTAPVDIPEDYDSNSFNEDRYVYKFGEKIGGGAVTEEERQEAKRRLELVLGIDDADTVTDWSAVSFDPDYVKDLNVLNGSSETYQDVLTKTTQYDADKIADDILVLRDYYENNGSRSADEVQRAGNRVKAATGVDVLNAEDFESAFDQAVQNNDALRDAVAQAVYNETGTMPDGAEFDLDNYLTYIQAYMQQQNHVDHAEAEQLQFDDTIQQKYGQYETAADYATLSQPVSLDITPTTEAEAIHEAIVAIDNPELFDQLVDGMTGMPTAAQQKYTADTITSEQRKMFNYLWNSGRQDEAMEYLDDIDWSVRKAIAAKTEEVSQELSEGVGGGIGSSLASVLMSPARAVVAPVNAARTALGQEIDEYDQGFNVGRASDTIRGNVGQNLDELLNGANILGWNIGSGVYQGAMSIADSWMTAPLGANLGAATMGLEAADSAMREGLEKGRTQTEALRDAAVTAGVEWATEKLPLENLFGDVGKPGKYIISNMFSEMGEEITSEVAEMIYDTLAYGDESDLGELYNDLVTQGYDKKGVTKEMLKEIAGRLRDAGFGGAAGGLIGAAPRGIATAVSDRSSGRNLQANDAARSMLDLAGKVLPSGEAKSLASEQLQEIDSRGEASNAKVGRVYRELLNNIDEQTRQVVDDTMLRNVRKQLKSMGEGSTELAEAVTRVVAGDGSAQAEDYAMVGANDAARELATSLTERVNEARGLAETADDLAVKASRKIEDLKKTTPAAEKATDTAVNESVNEDVDEWSELYADEDISDDIDEDSEFEIPEAEVSTTKDGEEVSIIGAESVGTDGELMYKVKTADGEQKTVKATDVNIGTNDDASARLAEYARQYGTNAESMFNARLESQDVDAYAEAFQRAVEYGSDGRNLDTVSKYSSLSELNPNQIRIAYEIGRAERITRADLTQQGKIEKLAASGSVPVGNVDISKIKSVNSLNKHQKNSIVAMRSIADLLGINVEFFESTADAQGKYQGKQGGWNPETLTLSMDIHAGSNYAGDLNYALMHTAGHELTHMIFEFANSDVRNGYQEYIMDQLSQKMSVEELDARVEKLLELPEINSRDAAIEEIVAEASVEALSKMTDADIQDLLMQNRPLYKRIAYSIAQWARGMKKKIANAFKGTEAKNEYAKMLNDQLDELALKWIDALKGATVSKHIRTGVEMATQEDIDAKYGIESDSSDADERKFKLFDDNEYDDFDDLDELAWDGTDKEDWDDDIDWDAEDDEEFDRDLSIIFGHDDTGSGDGYHEADSNFGITDEEVDDYFYKFYDSLMKTTKERIARGDTPRTKVLYAFDDSDLSFESRRDIRLRELVMEKVMEELRAEGFLEAEAQQEVEAQPEVQTQQEVQAEVLQEVETQQEVQQEIQAQEETQAEVQEEAETQPAAQQEETEWWEDSAEEKPAKAQDSKAKEASETRPLKSAHIDQRSRESIRSEDKTLFCSEVEEAQIAYAEAANILLDDLEQSAPGQKFYIWDEMGDLTVTGQKRVTSELLADIKDTTGWTWDKIKSTLQQFSDMGNAEKEFRVPKNTVATREMELYLDEMLSKGYKTLDGHKISPWGEYVEAKRGYQGSVSEDVSPTAYEGAIDFAEYISPSLDDFYTDGESFQLRDPDQVSDRELLANAMDSAATNEAELDFVRRYRKKINELEQKQARYEEVRQEIQDAQRNGVRKSDIAVLETKAKTLGDQLDRVDGQLLKFEAGKPLQAVVQRQREQLKQKLKLKQDAALKRQETRLKQQKRDALQRLSDKKNAALATQREQLKQEEKNALKKLRDEKNALLARQYKELKQEKTEKVREVRAEKDESFAKSKYRKAVEKEFSALREWVTSPTTKAHVPEFLRAPLGDVLSSLDFSSKRSLDGGSETQRDVKFKNALDKMNTALTELRTQRATALENLTDGQGGLDNSAARFALTIDLPDGYNEAFTTLVQGIKDHLDATQSSNTAPINRMTSTQLKELTKSLRILATSVRQMNRLLANAKYDSAVTAARDTMDELGKMAPKKDSIKATAWIGKFLDWTNTVPYYAFKRFGSGGKAIFDGLMDGWDKLAFNSDQVVKFAEDTYTTREVRKWSKKMNTVKLDSGDTVRMTTAQMMSLYCLSKRTQAIGHLLGGGIRIADIESGTKVVRQAENHTLTQHDLQNIASTLTERQRTVADKLQEFMSTQCTEWGNEVSMKRFGYKMLTEKNYFPIESDPNNLSAVSEKSEGESLFRLLNMSSMKELKKGANNALVVHDIFNVFSSHSADMAKYNALGLQILDAMKWLNYVEKTNTPDGSHTTRSVQKSLERAYGKDARQYILNLLKDLNGTKEGGRNDGIINKLISNAKVSDVASNLRVYLLQITSMPRAAYAISPKYLSIGLAKASANPLKAMRTATDKVGIAKWKDMGFYDTNISGNIREMIKHDQSLVNKTREVLMAPAGWADNMTMGTIYYAAEAECAKRHPNVQKGSATWDKLVNNRVREIVYQTQVVDSTMTRSDIMRGKGIATLTTAFMSEPTLSLNMLADGVYEARMAKRSGASAGAPIAKIARGAATFVVTAVVTAAFEAAFDAARDDDEFETLDEKYMAALIGDFTEDDTSWQKFAKVLFSDLGDNLNFISNIPGVSKLFDSLQGYDDTTMYTEFFNYMIKSYDAYQDTLDNKGTDYNWIYKALKGLSAAVGLPFSNATRDAVSIWNTFLADRLNKPRIQTYANTETQAAEAIVAAQKAGDTERVARIRQRASVYGMSEDKINSKVAKLAEEELASGKIDRSTATDLMTGEGNQRASETKSALNSADYQLATGGLKLSEMSDDYIAGTITEAQARQYLAKYKGLRGEEIDTEISKWNYERDTGMTYSQMKTDYLDGVLTDSEVLRYRTKYGGVEQESAQSTLDHWKYEADTGLAWDELEDDYGDGVITEAQVRQYLAKYDGKTEAEVDDKINAMDYHIATGRTGTCKYWRIAYAFDNGEDYATIIDEAFDKIMHGGEKEKTWKQARSAVVSSLASYYKADYEAVKGTAEGDAMVERILPLFEAIGYDREYQREYIAEHW